jgi:phosphatidylserine decarboxylase
MFNTIFPNIHKEGYKFLAISIIATFLVLLFSKFLGSIFILLTIWVYYFFRDPERVSINDDKFLVSPADGIISGITEVEGPAELNLENKKFTRVSIFMNVFDCHVNRMPSSGTVEEIFYKPGKFLNASLDKASEENERNYYKLKTEKNDDEIIIVQIAGLIARRIVCEVNKDQQLNQGDRIGMIRFGSRVDLYFNNRKILAKVGQKTTAGESLIAES